MAVFDGKLNFLEKYYAYEDQFMKEANRVILIDDG